MFQEMMLASSGGGGTLNPSISDYLTDIRRSGTMKQYTVDASKHYILVLCFKSNDASHRTNICYIHNGTLEYLDNPQESTGMTASISGNIVTVSGINSNSYYNDIVLIQLD